MKKARALILLAVLAVVGAVFAASTHAAPTGGCCPDCSHCDPSCCDKV